MGAIKRPSLLIVEDEEDLREITREWFEAEDFIVITSESKADAMFKLKNQPFDCILLDLKIKGGDGTDIISYIRNDKGELNRSTPIIVLSGHIDKMIIAEHGNKISAAVVKPVDRPQLIEKVKQVMAGHRMRRPGVLLAS